MGVAIGLALAAAATQCPAIAGVEPILADTSTHWLLVGEQHGTRETPEAFANLVCLAGQARPAVSVALELPVEMQARLDSYMASDGGAAARSALLADSFWHEGRRDGRSSAAMLALIEELRVMKAAGRIARVFAMRPANSGQYEAEAFEAAMAGQLVKGSQLAEGLVVALIGNFHTRLSARSESEYMPMGGYLPPNGTVSLAVTGNGGAQWACRMGEETCGPSALPTPQTERPRGIVMADDPAGVGYTGWFNLGQPMSASAPAVPE